jgi:hypothetical protein
MNTKIVGIKEFESIQKLLNDQILFKSFNSF